MIGRIAVGHRAASHRLRLQNVANHAFAWGSMDGIETSSLATITRLSLHTTAFLIPSLPLSQYQSSVGHTNCECPRIAMLDNEHTAQPVIRFGLDIVVNPRLRTICQWTEREHCAPIRH
jgi:hypothetical protein